MAQAPQLSQSRAEGIAAICSIGRDRLQLIYDRLDAAGVLISRVKIENLIDEQVGHDLGSELCRFLFEIALGFRQDSSGPAATLERISNLVEQQPDEDSRFAAWRECQPFLLRLLSSQSIKLAAKALEVSYDFERIYQAGRFLTTLRPIFDDARENILGGTIVQTLRLEFFSISGEILSLSVAMDRADIEQLRRSCDEALRKADATYEMASGVWKLPTIMPGQDGS